MAGSWLASLRRTFSGAADGLRAAAPSSPRPPPSSGEHGLKDVVEEALVIETRFASFDGDYWPALLEKQGPAGAYTAALPPGERERLRLRLRSRLVGNGADQMFTLKARAWGVRAEGLSRVGRAPSSCPGRGHQKKPRAVSFPGDACRDSKVPSRRNLAEGWSHATACIGVRRRLGSRGVAGYGRPSADDRRQLCRVADFGDELRPRSFALVLVTPLGAREEVVLTAELKNLEGASFASGEPPSLE